jgi:hypothetical protein
LQNSGSTDCPGASRRPDTGRLRHDHLPEALVGPTSTTAPTPVETTPAVVATGDVITAEQVAALDAKVQRAFAMADGTFVATTLTEAIPATVVADITATALATYPAGDFIISGSDRHEATQAALDARMQEIGVALGRRVVVVTARKGRMESTQSPLVPIWFMSVNKTAYMSRAEGAAAAAYVASTGVGSFVVMLDFAV